MGDVVNIGELRIARERRGYLEGCQHKRLTMDDNGGIVQCEDCTQQITPYFALQLLVEQWERAQEKLRAGQQAHAEALTKGVGLRAAQKVEQAWRSRSMVPCCPHCHEAIFPEDGFGGSRVNREIALRRRAARTTGAPSHE